jgi:hypothetical protein
MAQRTARRSSAPKPYLVIALAILALCAGLWLLIGRASDTVDSSAEVPRGANAPTEPDPEIERTRQLLERAKTGG